jgi:hypothetical protein
MPEFPLRTKIHKNRGGALIDGHDMQQRWRGAAKKAKLWQEGLGPHTLRSTFKSQCGKLGVARAVSEFCMGHGGGDQYGYSREVLDEQYVAGELGKLWAGQTTVLDPLISGQTKFNEILKVTRDPKMVNELVKQRLTPAEIDAVVAFNKQLEDAKPKEIRNRIDRIGDLIRLRVREATIHLQPSRGTRREREHRRPARTALNGGTLVRDAYETRVVGEAELVPLLNQGYDVVKELADGRVIVRRVLDREDAVSGEE